MGIASHPFFPSNLDVFGVPVLSITQKITSHNQRIDYLIHVTDRVKVINASTPKVSIFSPTSNFLPKLYLNPLSPFQIPFHPCNAASMFFPTYIQNLVKLRFTPQRCTWSYCSICYRRSQSDWRYGRSSRLSSVGRFSFWVWERTLLIAVENSGVQLILAANGR